MTVLVQGPGGDNHLNVTEGKALKGQSGKEKKKIKKPKDAKVAKNNGRELDKKNYNFRKIEYILETRKMAMRKQS